MTRIVLCAATALTTTALMTPGWAQTPAPPSSAAESSKFAEGAGKAVLFKLCKECHGPEQVAAELRTRAEWSKTLDTMAGYGAQGSDEEYNQLLEYLVSNFSPIQINKAAAGELAAVMDVSAAVADAIVSYRTAHGNFTSTDDLRKVPGLDRANVDARTDRLIF